MLAVIPFKNFYIVFCLFLVLIFIFIYYDMHIV